MSTLASRRAHAALVKSLPVLPTLGTLKVGQSARISAIRPGALHGRDLERRLVEMGFEEGALVEVLHQGFPKRDPIAVRIGSFTVALRRKEAEAVVLEPTPHS